MNNDKRNFFEMFYAKEVVYLGTFGIFQFPALFI